MIFLMMFGCLAGPHEGVLVGNPGEGTIQTAEADAATFRSGSAALAAARAEPCDGDAVVIVENITVDLLGSSRFVLPDAELCVLHLDFDGPLVWSVESPGRATHTLQLDVPELTFNGDGFTASGAALLIELGEPGWLPELSGDVTDDPDLISAIEEGSALYADEDADGVVDPGEPRLARAGADQAAAVSEAGGCGQEEVETAARALLLPLALLGWRRRSDRQQEAPLEALG